MMKRKSREWGRARKGGYRYSGPGEAAVKHGKRSTKRKASR